MGPDPAIFRALIERCPMVTYVADADGAITYISAADRRSGPGCRRTCWTDDPAFWHTLIHPDDRERVVAADVRRRDARHRVPDARPRRRLALGLGARGRGPGSTRAARASASTSRALRETPRGARGRPGAARRGRQRRAGDPLRHRPARDHHALGGQGAREPRPRSGRDGRARRSSTTATCRSCPSTRAARWRASRSRLACGSATRTFDCSWHGLRGRLDDRRSRSTSPPAAAPRSGWRTSPSTTR